MLTRRRRSTGKNSTFVIIFLENTRGFSEIATSPGAKIWQGSCLSVRTTGNFFVSEICFLTFSERIALSGLFPRRFREGISFPNFVERSILELPLSKLCAVPFTLQNRALFEGEKKAKRCREEGRKRGGQQRGQKGKKDA